jgi:hypothetical protein
VKGFKKKLISKGLDLQLWQQYYNRNQQEYKRKPLRAVKLVYEGHSPRLRFVKHSTLVNLLLTIGLNFICIKDDIAYGN